jgi:hypothetical protein
MGDITSSPRVEDILLGDGTVGPYVLSRKPVIIGSLVVTRAGVPVPDSAYVLGARHGTVTFHRPVPEGDTLAVSYMSVPITLAPTYALRPLTRELSSAPDETTTVRTPAAPKPAYGGLRLGGSKTFALSAGTASDVDVEQGLSLDLSGNIARDVTVRGHLSDRATAPGATATALSELDRIYVEVEGPRARARLGDFDLVFDETELSSYERRLQGAEGTLTTKPLTVTAGAASSRGRYAVNRFSGVDEVQGPYRLSGASGERNVAVLPGSEKVYLDGVRMRRGSDYDYVMEYERGRLTFTPRRRIGLYSRIEVEFLYATTDYPRNFAAGRASGAVLDSAVRWGVTVVRESDDTFGPSARSLSEEDIHNLSAAGDDPALAERDGGVFVGEGEGDYELATDTLGNPYYNYVGPDSGNYDVGFTYAGEGEYAYTGAGVYVYVGPTGGSYSALVQPSLPERRTLAAGDFSVKQGSVHLSVEAALSEHDRNTLSALDDSDNLSGAGRARVRFESETAPLGFDRFSTDLSLRAEGGGFAPFSRVDEPDVERIWSLPSASDSADVFVAATSVSFSADTTASVHAEAGIRSESNGLLARRASGDVALRPGRTRISLRGSWAKSESDRTEIGSGSRRFDAAGELAQGVWVFEPFTSVYYEGTDLSGVVDSVGRSVVPGGGLRFRHGGLDVELSSSHRTDRLLSGGDWLESRRTVSYSMVAALRSGSSFDGSVSAVHSTTDRSLPTSSFEISDLIVLGAGYHPIGRVVDVRADYTATTRRSSRALRSYVAVSPGEGDYIYDDGEYIPDPEGDYVLIEEADDDGPPVIEVDASLSVSVVPHRWKSAGSTWLYRVASLRLDASVYEQTATDRRADVLLLNPSVYHVPGRTVQGRTDLVAEVRVLPTHRDLDLRFSARRFDLYDASFDEDGETLYDASFSALVSWNASDDVTVRGEAERGFLREGRSGRSGADATVSRLLAGAARSWPREVSLDVRAQARFEHDRVLPERVRMFSVMPRFERWLFGRGRAVLDGRWDRVTTESGRSSLPYALAEGKPPGDSFRWSAAFYLDLGRDVTATSRYSGVAEAERPVRHTVRVEAVATF